MVYLQNEDETPRGRPVWKNHIEDDTQTGKYIVFFRIGFWGK